MLVWKLSLPSQAAVHPHRIFFARFSARRTASRRDRPNNRELKDEQTGIIPNWNPPADTARGQKWGAAWELRRFVALSHFNSPALLGLMLTLAMRGAMGVDQLCVRLNFRLFS